MSGTKKLREKINKLYTVQNVELSGYPVLWTRAGGIDRLKKTYHSRFFSDIKCLALTCDTDELKRRMMEGRNITSEEWLCGSADYNNYFKTHDKLGDVNFEQLNITNMNVEEIADHVITWVENNKR